MNDRNAVRGTSGGTGEAGDERSEKLLLLGLLAAGFAMALITTAEGALFRFQRGDSIQLGLLLGGRLADWYTCAALVPPLYWLTTRFPIEGRNWQRPAAIHLAASAAAAFLKIAIYVPLRRFLDPGFDTAIVDAIEAGFLGKLMFFWAVAGTLHAIFFCRRAQAERSQAEALRDKLSRLGRGTIALPHASGTRYLPFAEIDWIEAQGNYLQIHAGSRKHLVRGTMRGFSRSLDDGVFIRVHRSAIVNSAAVRLIEPASNSRYRLALRNGDTVTSARSYHGSLRSLLS